MATTKPSSTLSSVHDLPQREAISLPPHTQFSQPSNVPFPPHVSHLKILHSVPRRFTPQIDSLQLFCGSKYLFALFLVSHLLAALTFPRSIVKHTLVLTPDVTQDILFGDGVDISRNEVFLCIHKSYSPGPLNLAAAV